MGAVRVLVVDDEGDFRASVRTCLEREGYAVQEAVDGAEALKRLEAETYDLALVDLSLPRLPGLRLLEVLRAAGRPAPPTIIVTAFGDWGSYARALELGALTFLSKPLSMADLLREVARALAARPGAGAGSAPGRT
jgi:DNA-binding response OmpR family regulator